MASYTPHIAVFTLSVIVFLALDLFSQFRAIKVNQHFLHFILNFDRNISESFLPLIIRVA